MIIAVVYGIKPIITAVSTKDIFITTWKKSVVILVVEKDY